jgi:hypothetical protein
VKLNVYWGHVANNSSEDRPKFLRYQKDFINMQKYKNNYCSKRTINASAETIFLMLTTLEGLNTWWENPVTGAPVKNGDIEFKFSDASQYSVMHVDLAEKPAIVHWTVMRDTGYCGEWLGTKILFEIEENQEQCILHFCHIGLHPGLITYDSCVAAWDRFLNNIVSGCEEETAGKQRKTLTANGHGLHAR